MLINKEYASVVGPAKFEACCPACHKIIELETCCNCGNNIFYKIWYDKLPYDANTDILAQGLICCNCDIEYKEIKCPICNAIIKYNKFHEKRIPAKIIKHKETNIIYILFVLICIIICISFLFIFICKITESYKNSKIITEYDLNIGNAYTIEKKIKRGVLITKSNINYALMTNINNKNEILKLFIENNKTQNLNDILIWASNNNETELINLCIQYGANIFVNEGLILNNTFKFNNIQLRNNILKNKEIVYNFLLCSIKNNDDVIFKYLIDNKKIILNQTNIYKILGYACNNKNITVVNYFIKNSDTDIHFQNDYLLKWAIINNQIEIIKLCILRGAELSFNNNYDNNELIKSFFNNNNEEIFDIIIAANFNKELYKVILELEISKSEYLLYDKNEIFLLAVSHSNYNLVKLFIKVDKNIIKYRNGEALSTAILNENKKMYDILKYSN
jgi:hypothetical protein